MYRTSCHHTWRESGSSSPVLSSDILVKKQTSHISFELDKNILRLCERANCGSLYNWCVPSNLLSTVDARLHLHSWFGGICVKLSVESCQLLYHSPSGSIGAGFSTVWSSNEREKNGKMRRKQRNSRQHRPRISATLTMRIQKQACNSVWKDKQTGKYTNTEGKTNNLGNNSTTKSSHAPLSTASPNKTAKQLLSYDFHSTTYVIPALLTCAFTPLLFLIVVFTQRAPQFPVAVFNACIVLLALILEGKVAAVAQRCLCLTFW